MSINGHRGNEEQARKPLEHVPLKIGDEEKVMAYYEAAFEAQYQHRVRLDILDEICQVRITEQSYKEGEIGSHQSSLFSLEQNANHSTDAGTIVYVVNRPEYGKHTA